MSDWLLALMLGLSTPLYAEEPMEQAERFGTIAAGVERAVELERGAWPWTAEELGTAVLAVTAAESGKWHPKVHSGKLKGDGGASHCLGGIMRGTGWWTDKEWRGAIGTSYEPTVQCMSLTVRALARHASRCFGRNGAKASAWSLGVVFYAYGTGKGCTRKPPKWALDRAYFWSRLEKRRRGD